MGWFFEGKSVSVGFGPIYGIFGCFLVYFGKNRSKTGILEGVVEKLKKVLSGKSIFTYGGFVRFLGMSS